jgi:hypothetical protein
MSRSYLHRIGGRTTKPLLIAAYHSDPGVTLGAGFDSQGFDFRRHPWANRHILKGGFGFGALKGFVDYAGDFRRRSGIAHGVVNARASGIDRLRWNRFGGDASLYGDVRLRWAFKKLTLAVPGELGVTVGADVGRVWLQGEDSNKWHPSWNVAIFFAPFNRLMLFEVGRGQSEEKHFWVFTANVSALRFASH